MKIESDVHSKNMIKFAQENEDVLVLSADLGTSCEVKEFPKVFPEKFINGDCGTKHVKLGSRIGS